MTYAPLSLDPADHGANWWWEWEIRYRECGKVITRHLKRTLSKKTPGTQTHRHKASYAVVPTRRQKERA